VKLTTKHTKDTQNFVTGSLCETLAIRGARAASPQCSAACRAQIPSAGSDRCRQAACAPRRTGSERRV